MDDQLYRRLERIEKKLDDNTQTTQDGFSKVNGRISSLERKEAYREGLEKGLGNVNQDWKKATFKLLGIVSAIIGVASTAAFVAAKAIGI